MNTENVQELFDLHAEESNENLQLNEQHAFEETK